MRALRLRHGRNPAKSGTVVAGDASAAGFGDGGDGDGDGVDDGVDDGVEEVTAGALSWS